MLYKITHASLLLQVQAAARKTGKQILPVSARTPDSKGQQRIDLVITHSRQNNSARGAGAIGTLYTFTREAKKLHKSWFIFSLTSVYPLLRKLADPY